MYVNPYYDPVQVCKPVGPTKTLTLFDGNPYPFSWVQPSTGKGVGHSKFPRGWPVLITGVDRLHLWNDVEALYISKKLISNHWLIEFQNNVHDETKLCNNMPWEEYTLFSKNQQYTCTIWGTKFHNISVGSGLGPWQERLMWAHKTTCLCWPIVGV